MEKKSGKPPKPLRLLVNLFNKTTKGKSNKNDNTAAPTENTVARGARDRNDNGECRMNECFRRQGSISTN